MVRHQKPTAVRLREAGITPSFRLGKTVITSLSNADLASASLGRDKNGKHLYDVCHKFWDGDIGYLS